MLKPGSFFVSYEWLTTSNFDETNATHVKLIQDVVTGNALPNMRSEKDVRAAAKKVGFEIVMIQDQSVYSEVPWYITLKRSTWSRNATQIALTIMEFLRMVPSGTSMVHLMLCKAADGLIASGSQKIFTPMCTCVFLKP